MITKEQLFGKKYSFKHIDVKVIEKDNDENVLVFSASVVKTKLPGQAMSEGMMEINKTLWDPSSSKRPKGYLSAGSVEKDGLLTCYFVSDEWLKNTPKEIIKAKETEWGL
ncbi:hypothetical protein ACFVS2_21725 [Brevibacillus sp. NPDC058079]|uniref:hypothetical protein n=1 Tax=Brevibacillus sp. NPDC058079 TaxID=3346330 RepID=UPI0036E72F1C